MKIKWNHRCYVLVSVPGGQNTECNWAHSTKCAAGIGCTLLWYMSHPKTTRASVIKQPWKLSEIKQLIKLSEIKQLIRLSTIKQLINKAEYNQTAHK